MASLKWNQFKCFSLLWLSYCSTYFLRKPLGVIKTVLGSELQLSMNQLGWLDTALILPYAAIQIGFPGLSDKYGARPILVACLVGGGMSSYLSSLAPSFNLLAASLIFTGCFLAPCWPASSKLLSSWFQDSRLNSVFGLINTATYTGGLGGTALATALLQYSGWRSVFLPPAVLSVVVALTLFVFLKTPDQLEIVVPGKENRKPPVIVSAAGSQTSLNSGSQRSLASLLRIPAVKELSVTMFCLKFVRYLMYMWLPLYLVETLKYSTFQAGMFSTMFDVGGIVGSPLLGLALDKLCPKNPLKGVTAALLTGTLSLGLFIMTARWGFIANGLCLFVSGAANCGPDSILAGSVSTEVGERGGRGEGAGVTSLVNGLGNLGGMVEGPLVGLVWGQAGWAGVLAGALAMTGIATLSCYRAHSTTQATRLNLPTLA